MSKMYTTQTISGYNDSPPSDDGSQTTANEITWAKHKNKLGDPVKTLAEAINTQLVSALGTDLDLDGDMRLILDQDGDTIIDAAAVDDRIDIAIGGSDSIYLGHATGNTGAFVHVDPGAFTSTANTSIGLLRVGNTNAVTIPAGTTSIGASAWFEAPNWTETGTLTSSATVYIEGAATEGTNNYSLWVDAGVSQFDGTVNTASALTVGNDIVSDTDSTDDLGTTSVRWANVFTDSIGDSGQALNVAATTFSFDAAATIDTSGNNALTINTGTSDVFIKRDSVDSSSLKIGNTATAALHALDVSTNGGPARIVVGGHEDGVVGLDEEIGSIVFYSRDSSTTSTGGIASISAAAEAAYNTSSTPSRLVFSTHSNSANDGTLFGNTTEAMRIDANQDVHIGGTSPSARLHVTDSARAVAYLESTDATANSGPQLRLWRNSASPLANDEIGLIAFNGENDAGTEVSYADITGVIIDPAAASIDGELKLRTAVAGTVATRVTITAGVQVGSPTGGDQGAGTLNATAVYDDGSLLTDYVLDQAVDNTIDYDWYDRTKLGGTKAREWDVAELDIDHYAAKWRERKALPGMRSKAERFDENGEEIRDAHGELIQSHTQNLEVMAVHIAKLNERIKELEGRMH